MTNLASRLLVAAAGLPVVLGVAWLGGWWLFTLATAAGLMALHELYAMTRPLRPLAIAGYAGLVVLLLGIQLGGLVWGAGGLVLALALAFLLKGIGDTKGSATVAVGTTVLGPLWVGFGLGCLMLIRDIPEFGRVAIFAVLLSVFASDTAAYTVGKLAGRHKLAPAISPGKTWEGFVAGVIFGVFVAFIALYEDRSDFLSIGQSLLFGLAIALAGPVGDLFESALKRDLRVKDAGRSLGGHGGMLDRIDSLLFAAVAAFYVILAFYP
jgi:phosphatidate cytidylyltransferase